MPKVPAKLLTLLDRMQRVAEETEDKHPAISALLSRQADELLEELHHADVRKGEHVRFQHDDD